MRHIIKNKRAISEVVAYVLLIVISLSIATSVYYWLKGQLPNDNNSIECEEGVRLNIREYNYNCSTKMFNLTVENRGLFNIDGFIVRVNNETGKTIGIYTLNKTGAVVNLSSRFYLNYNFSGPITAEIPSKKIAGTLTFLEVQPLLLKKGKLVFCENVISQQKIQCTP